MNWVWATSLEDIWRSPSFPMGLTIAAAGFFAVIVLITLLRAEKSVANGALTVITLLAIGIAVASTLRGYGPTTRTASRELGALPMTTAASPALSCVDDLAGDAVAQACEKVVFGSPESIAAAVNYAASMVTRLTALGDTASAQRTMSLEMQALRRAVERDRYGLVAQVLLARDRCTPAECPAYRSLTDNHQIITNMDEHLYDNLVTRYAASWNAPPPAAAATSAPPGTLQPSMPTGRPTNAEFPSAANTPAVSIMTPEPGTGTAVPRQSSGSAKEQAKEQAPAAAASSPPPAAKRVVRQPKQEPKPAPPPAVVSAPTSIAPGAQTPPGGND